MHLCAYFLLHLLKIGAAKERRTTAALINSCYSAKYTQRERTCSVYSHHLPVEDGWKAPAVDTTETQQYSNCISIQKYVAEGKLTTAGRS